MSSPLTAVMFDLDGTLLDTAPDFVMALNQLRRDYNKEGLPFNVIREQVSNGAAALVTLGFDCTTEDKTFAPLRQQLLDHYLHGIGKETRFFPGIETLLQDLKNKGVPWGIATNKPRLYTEALLKKINFPTPPNFVVCPDDVVNRKPHPESLILAAKHLKVDCQNILYLGDHRRDIECGNDAGATTIACGYGYIDANDPAESWLADFLVQHSEQLPDLVHHLLMQSRDR
ncbi:MULTISPECIES: HAD family hydrolase [unclassified Gilvimarinus]|uniref:HAD family hydrolase n=1 Tax=unclassified Gilvimarinus TaxID=2642066 RepID=UPI0026E3DC62|nr:MULTISPECIES: HAD-IA family hydrolase [unclassified Gilvimarinus]MDO6571865.1 HAD-IA family hydrolase [Gilvimarinus sp. 2_MG-2023]MDO6745934.1 HAD-IA family hydrolase [Gilvimarinus sp. 1_MG-2023]